MTSSRNTGPIPCACLKCSSATLRRPRPGAPLESGLPPLCGALLELAGYPGKGWRESVPRWRLLSIKPSKRWEDIENLKFNTAIAALMSLINDIYDSGSITPEELKVFTILLNPFAPHVTEEVWSLNKLGEKWYASSSGLPMTRNKCKDETIEIVVQVNGKVRGKLSMPADVARMCRCRGFYQTSRCLSQHPRHSGVACSTPAP